MEIALKVALGIFLGFLGGGFAGLSVFYLFSMLVAIIFSKDDDLYEFMFRGIRIGTTFGAVAGIVAGVIIALNS